MLSQIPKHYNNTIDEIHLKPIPSKNAETRTHIRKNKNIMQMYIYLFGKCVKPWGYLVTSAIGK